MIHMPNVMKAAATISVATLLSVGALGGTASAMEARDATETFGRLTALNNSGVEGSAEATVSGRRVVVDVDACRLLKGLPHAQHIHFGAKARNECPTAADAGSDHQLTTVDGLPAYGPVRVSLTTSGNTGAKSALAVDRFPAAPNGTIRYNRQVRTSKAVAHAIREGKGVYVVHGVDYNGNGTYDFKGNGKSDLDPSLPAEATDPAACTLLNVQR
jgi:hypothetical protein